MKARLLGHLHLPWEGQLRPDVKRKLGAFQEPVLRLLQREPSQRMTMNKFHTSCTKLFDRQATTDTAGVPTSRRD